MYLFFVLLRAGVLQSLGLVWCMDPSQSVSKWGSQTFQYVPRAERLFGRSWQALGKPFTRTVSNFLENLGPRSIEGPIPTAGYLLWQNTICPRTNDLLNAYGRTMEQFLN